MKRGGRIFVALVCVLVLGSGLWLARKWQIRRGEMTARAEAVLQNAEALGPEGREKYRNLAKWYNYNLERGTPGLWSYYPEILDLGKGAMAVLEVPEWDLLLPVFHGAAVPVGHDPATPLPLGGRGNHTVLTISNWFPWREGQRLYIDCLGQKLCYRVESVRVLSPGWSTDRPTEGGQELLTLVFDHENSRTIIRCIRSTELELREEPRREYFRATLTVGPGVLIFLLLIYGVRKIWKNVRRNWGISPKKWGKVGEI